MIQIKTIHQGSPATTIYLCMGEQDKDSNDIIQTLERLGANTDFLLVALMSNDRNGDYSPWAAPPVFGKDGFAGNGSATLRWLVEECIPKVEQDERIPSIEQGDRPKRRLIVGYSLAGLFALWTAMETQMFDGVASCSGSLWFPRWLEYMESHRMASDTHVYLSLGDKEEKTKNQVMATVGDNTRRTFDILNRQCSTVLEWNSGGHFNEPMLRLAKGIAWLVR